MQIPYAGDAPFYLHLHFEMGATLCIPLFVRGLFLAALPMRPTRRLIVTIATTSPARNQNMYKNAKTTQRQCLFALPAYTHTHTFVHPIVCHFLFFHSIRFQATYACVCASGSASVTDLNISFLSFIDAHVLSPLPSRFCCLTQQHFFFVNLTAYCANL